MTTGQGGSGTRAADTLIRTFERQILDGTLRDGEMLPTERDIVPAHGVSRTVVREAVLALSNRGLVEARPRHRPVVRRPGYDAVIEVVSSSAQRLLAVPGGIRNLFELRILLEAALARQAALSAGRDQIAGLKSALAANRASIEDSALFYQTDMAFHEVLYHIPCNPLLVAIHRAYTGWLSGHWTQMPRLPARNRSNCDAHQRIFDAILMRDPDLAEAETRAHLDQAWEQVRQTFDGDV